MLHGPDPLGSSFYDLLVSHYPHLTPFQVVPPGTHAAIPGPGYPQAIPHGTTILAIRYAGGVVVGGDRRATEGYQISARRIDKVYRVDESSVIAIAGAAGPCLDMVRLFQTELEHYEKLEGTSLSIEGKANKLAQMVKGNLPAAFQGLVVIPIFAGYDVRQREGRIFKYDVAGGRYEETDYYAAGSGGKDARTTIKQSYSPALTQDDAIAAGLEALLSAAEEDVATAGPDPVRGIYPTMKVVTSEGVVDVPSTRIESFYTTLLGKRRGR